ncbi:MAG: FAD-dependent oxidoreductase [Oscillospiraceae bacterium]|nr:FAD-dependent oxidoreductase [Oscillospiraceae bacterium]
MNRFPKCFEPLKINDAYTMKNRITCAPMAFALIACDPEASEKSFRKLEAPARGGDAMVSVGELDVNFTDAVRIPLPPVDFTEKDSYAVQRVGEYARRIHRHGAIALCELAHPGAEKMPFDETQEAIGPNDEVRLNGVRVRAMTKADMDRVAGDFVKAAGFVKNCGFDGVVIHGGHGFIFTQFLSSAYNKRTDEYGGSLENRARFPIQILRAIREHMGKDFIIELRISGDDLYSDDRHGVTPEETGRFAHMLEGIVDLIQVSVGIYYDAIETHQFSSMFVPHGVNAPIAAIVKQYTSIPVGVIGGINSPELMEQILESGQADYIALGRQSLADPELANKARRGEEDRIRRCLRCFKCFPGSPEEGYTDLPFTSNELAKVVGACTINPTANLPFDPWSLPPAPEKRRILVVGGGPAGMQAAITASDRGHEVILAERGDRLGGLLFFTDTDVDKPDLRGFRDMLIREVERRDIDLRLNTEVTAENLRGFGAEELIIATGSLPACPPIPGIENAVQSLEVYRGNVVPGKRVIMVGGGLIGSEQGLHLARTGHDVTVVEMLPRVANEAYGMYREALMRELEKEHVALYENTRCLEIGAGFVRVLLPDGMEKTLEGDTVLYALGMKSVPVQALLDAAGDIPATVIGDAIRPSKVDQATRTGYLAGVKAGGTAIEGME